MIPVTKTAAPWTNPDRPTSRYDGATTLTMPKTAGWLAPLSG